MFTEAMESTRFQPFDDGWRQVRLHIVVGIHRAGSHAINERIMAFKWIGPLQIQSVVKNYYDDIFCCLLICGFSLFFIWVLRGVQMNRVINNEGTIQKSPPLNSRSVC